MAKQTLAVLTMFHDEPDFLPVWLRHYAAQAGADHCYLLDHGSAVGLEALAAYPEVKCRRLPPSLFDEDWWRQLVAETCRGLLHDYETVAFTDIDELLVPDPARSDTLRDFCRAGLPDVTTAFGANVLQVAEDAPLDWDKAIGPQRGWARPAGFYCKPALIRRPVTWDRGFHHADAPSVFAGLYLFHLAYVDYRLIKRRQIKRRRTPRPPGAAKHHDITPHDLVWDIRENYAGLPRTPLPTLGGFPELTFIRGLLERGEALPDGTVSIRDDTQAGTIWEIPPAFRAVF